MTVVKEEQDPALELLPPKDEAEAMAAFIGAEFFSSPLSSGEEAAGDDETDSEGGDGAGNVGGARPLRKGPWTPDEDKRLRDYVEAHGEGNWNQVQRNAGLNRCGKSCRLRWANHLRPDLKKGPFDAEEEDKIIRFHMAWGNKWARMAAHLPGRTDNEIKNYWNTRKKRLQRSGSHHLYPPEYSLSHVPDQDMNCHIPDESRGKKRSNELLQEKVVGMNDFDDVLVFEHLNYSEDPVVPNPLKRHASTGDLSCVQISDKTEKTFYSNDLTYVLTKSQSVPLGNAIAGGYPVFDGNPSASGTMHRSMKTELPSFQFSSYNSNSWSHQYPSASPIEQQVHHHFSQSLEYISSQNTGLLGATINKDDVLDDPTKSESLSEYIFSQSYTYPMGHPSSSVIGDCEPGVCPFLDLQASNSPSDASFSDAEMPGSDASFNFGNSDASFPDTGMFGASLETSFQNDLQPSKDQSYHYTSNSGSFEVHKPLTDAGQWLDPSAWESVSGARSMPDFPGL